MAGVVPGISRVDWGPHLDAICIHTQLQIEGWLVATGRGDAAMIARARATWERTWITPGEAGKPDKIERATWEDGEPAPWLRYPLVQNQIYNLPPSTLKSSIVMICACAWVWLLCPTFCFGAASGIDANVSRDSNATRDIIRSPWYRETFSISWDTFDIEDPEIKLRPDVDSVSDWATTAGGRRYSRTWQRGFTGLHCDGLFGDDPDDADRVHNESARVATQNKWTNAMETRVNDEHTSVRLVMQQVVHAEGMSAYLLAIARWTPANPKGWAQLCIPAEHGFGPDDAPRVTPYGWSDWRTGKGETMHARLSPGVLADKRLKLPGYEGQFNQNAKRIVDGLFSRGLARFFRWEDEPVERITRARPLGCVPRAEMPPIVIRRDELNRITLSVDAANSLDPKPGARVSAVGLIVGACRDEERFVLDDRTRVLGVDGTYQAIYELVAEWDLERILVELKALGASVIAELERSIKRGWYLDVSNKKIELLGPDGRRPRCAVEAFNPGKDTKVQRAHGTLPIWKQGMFYVHDGAQWLYPQVDDSRVTVDDGYIGEICSFPGSRRSDRMDATSQFVAKYRGVEDARTRWSNMSRLSRIVGAARR